MAQNPLERQLIAGVRAAQQGDKAKARELLEGVLKRDRTNEQAWIWLASVVDGPKERRVCIERVLKLNPKNRAAQDALNKMVGVLAGGAEASLDYAAMSKAAATPLPLPAGRTAPRAAGTGSGFNLPLIPILIVVAVILGIIFVITLLPPAPVEVEPTEVAEVIAEVSEEPSPTIDPLFTPPSPTIVPSPTFSGTISTREVTFPPTFTPTVTHTPTNTPTPTNTMPAISNYNWLFIATQNRSLPVLYRVNGTGEGLTPFLANVKEFDYDSNTGYIVFTEAEEVAAPEATEDPNASASGARNRMYLVPIGDIENRVEITDSNISSAISPSFSPDGQQIAFASDADGDYEIYIYDITTRVAQKVTNNEGISDRDPDWSPGGSNLIFSSDRDSIEFHNLYNMDLTASDREASVTRITDIAGNSLGAAWSPDSHLIAFYNVRSGNTKILVTDVEGTFIRELTFQPNLQYSQPEWTSDSLYIVYSAGEENSPHPLFFISPTGGQPRRLDFENLTVTQIQQR